MARVRAGVSSFLRKASHSKAGTLTSPFFCLYGTSLSGLWLKSGGGGERRKRSSHTEWTRTPNRSKQISAGSLPKGFLSFSLHPEVSPHPFPSFPSSFAVLFHRFLKLSHWSLPIFHNLHPSAARN